MCNKGSSEDAEEQPLRGSRLIDVARLVSRLKPLPLESRDLFIGSFAEATRQLTRTYHEGFALLAGLLR
jgi:hypothetical protein